MEDAHKEEIISIIKSKDEEIRIFQMTLNETRYELLAKEIRY